jgi:hypothetical protein
MLASNYVDSAAGWGLGGFVWWISSRVDTGSAVGVVSAWSVYVRLVTTGTMST